MRSLLTLFFIIGAAAVPLGAAHAQELYQDEQEVLRAKVVRIIDERDEALFGTEAKRQIQTLEAEIVAGERRGETVTFENDYILLEEGDTFYLRFLKDIDGRERYAVQEIDRRGALAVLVAVFAIVVLAFGGMQGLRSLASLAGSLLVIAYVLIPSLIAGYPPIPTSIAIAAAVLFLAIFFTHGFNRRSLIAFAGTMIAVAITGVFAHVAVAFTDLTGFANDESVYLNLNTGGQLDFVGLLLAAVIIGALGALDDIAVTQVAVVRELFSANDALSKWDVYRKAMRVGKEHVGALVNTLVFAYTGAALPLLLLFSFAEGGLLTIVNREIIATELVRTLVGSIGLVLTVPITTLLAVIILEKYRGESHVHEEHAHHAH